MRQCLEATAPPQPKIMFQCHFQCPASTMSFLTWRMTSQDQCDILNMGCAISNSQNQAKTYPHKMLSCIMKSVLPYLSYLKWIFACEYSYIKIFWCYEGMFLVLTESDFQPNGTVVCLCLVELWVCKPMFVTAIYGTHHQEETSFQPPVNISPSQSLWRKLANVSHWFNR